MVEAGLEYLQRDPREVIGEVPPKNRMATVEKVVVNSVMAGCLPEYIPVVIAALEGMLDDSFNLNGIQATTNCISPLAIVTGPVVDKLGFNAGDNTFGGGSRANAGRRPGGTADPVEHRRGICRRDRPGHPGTSGQIHLLHRREQPGQPLGCDSRGARISGGHFMCNRVRL